MKVGVLALQGAFREHVEVLDALGVEAVEVRRPEQLGALDALVLPGGESTTVGHLLRTGDMVEPLRERLAEGIPTLATCAGLILLAREVLDGRPDQLTLGALDVEVRRNAYGRQRDSFEASLSIDGVGDGFPGVFIRAPGIEQVGDGVDVVARFDDRIVMVRQDSVMACTFHPELSGDVRVHQAFLREVAR